MPNSNYFWVSNQDLRIKNKTKKNPQIKNLVKKKYMKPTIFRAKKTNMEFGSI